MHEDAHIHIFSRNAQYSIIIAIIQFRLQIFVVNLKIEQNIGQNILQ